MLRFSLHELWLEPEVRLSHVEALSVDEATKSAVQRLLAKTGGLCQEHQDRLEAEHGVQYR